MPDVARGIRNRISRLIDRGGVDVDVDRGHAGSADGGRVDVRAMAGKVNEDAQGTAVKAGEGARDKLGRVADKLKQRAEELDRDGLADRLEGLADDPSTVVDEDGRDQREVLERARDAGAAAPVIPDARLSPTAPPQDMAGFVMGVGGEELPRRSARDVLDVDERVMQEKARQRAEDRETMEDLVMGDSADADDTDPYGGVASLVFGDRDEDDGDDMEVFF